MTENNTTESKEFRAPFVRVRGRLSRTGEIQWNPSLRTEKGIYDKQSDDPLKNDSNIDNSVVSRKARFTVDFLDYTGRILLSGYTKPYFFSIDQEWAKFTARLPYHEQTQAIQLRVGERILGMLRVPTDRPCFTLLNPREDSCIDGSGVLHLRWSGHNSEYPITFFVRYSHNGIDWYRPGVNLHTNDYYLDLRDMPGGERCVIQVIATNGYRTSYIQTRHFQVPTKSIEILLGENKGPVLFAQGYSREHGPIVGEGITWMMDDGVVIKHGGTLDVRTLTEGVHRISIQLRDTLGKQLIKQIGTYNSRTGLLVDSNPL